MMKRKRLKFGVSEKGFIEIYISIIEVYLLLYMSMLFYRVIDILLRFYGKCDQRFHPAKNMSSKPAFLKLVYTNRLKSGKCQLYVQRRVLLLLC